MRKSTPAGTKKISRFGVQTFLTDLSCETRRQHRQDWSLSVASSDIPMTFIADTLGTR